MSRKVLTLPGWFIMSSVAACVGAAVLLSFLLLADDGRQPVADPAGAITAAPTATPSPTATSPTAPTPTPSPTPTATPAPPGPAPTPVRDLPVAVFNNTTTTGLARTVAADATAAGWTVTGTGNWRGAIPASTVYYPAGHAAEAHTLAADLGIGRVRAAVSPMSASRLTVVLAGQQ